MSTPEDLPEVLLVCADPPQVKAELAKHFVVHSTFDAVDADALIERVAPRVRALVTGTLVGADTQLINSLPNIEIVGISGGHVDRIDMATVRARGLPVFNTPGISAPDVADLGISMILQVSRRVTEADRFVRAGGWRKGPMPFGVRVTGKRLGIVGLGRIGRILAKRAEGFEMSVAYFGPRPKADVKYRYFDDIAAMAAQVDFLAVTCAMSERTHHLINAKVLDALGPKGVVVNVARGSIVDEQALIAALQAGTIAGAGIDVFEFEPAVPDALKAMENVVLNPHGAAFTNDAKRIMAELTRENLVAFFAGSPLITPLQLGH